MTQGEWISVDDRLPKVDVDVLVYANNEIFIAFLGYDNDWLYYEDVSSEEFPVEYWMSLPATPTCSEIPNNHKKGEQL